MKVAVIGAGLSGLSLSRKLADEGVGVQLFDKGRFPGGRLSTRDKEQGAFDHGAQRFNARSPEFRQIVAEWESLGWVHSTESPNTEDWWVPTPSARQLALNLGSGLKIEPSTRIQRILRKDGRWNLDSDGQSLGPFDVLVITAPAPQAAALLNPQHAFQDVLGSIRYSPTWVLFLCARLESQMATGIFSQSESGPVELVVRENQKPLRLPDGPFERLTVHASTDFSREHLESSPEEVRGLLVESLQQQLGAFHPVFAQAHRWRYARVENPLGTEFLYDSAKKLGLAGDYMLGSRVESAVISGRTLADEILRSS